MYIFIPKKYYSSLCSPYNHTFSPALNSSKTTHSISNTLAIMQKLGAKVYYIDQNSFTKISKLTGQAKIKFLESNCIN
jgi:hypothetical protein